MFGGLPVSDSPLASVAFHYAYTGPGPCHIATDRSKSTVVSMTVTRSTLITMSVTPVATITYTIEGG